MGGWGASKGSWKGKDSWSGFSTGSAPWGGNKWNIGKGKGKKFGANMWDENPDEGDWDEAKGGNSTNTKRILSRYQFAKKVLRASVQKDNSAFWKESTQKMTDQKFLERENLKQVLDADSSHLVRRPGTGISECAASVTAGLEILQKIKDDPEEVGFNELLEIFDRGGDGVARSMLFLNKKSSDNERSKEAISDSMQTFFKFIQENKNELHDLGANCAIAASRLYLASMSLLQMTTAISSRTWWAGRVPQDISKNKAVEKWRNAPENMDKTVKAMATLFMEKIKEDAAWGGEGNAASNVFKRRREKSPSEASGSSRSASSDSSEEERAKKSKDKKGKKDKDKKKDQKGKKKSKGDQERGDEKETGKKGNKGNKGNKDKKDKDNKDQKHRKKGKKRARKGNKTDSDTDSSKAESDSSSGSQKSAKSEKSAESCKKDTHILKVRRAMQVGIFSDDDRIDEVELTIGESIKSAVCKLLAQLKIADAIGDFNVKLVTTETEDGEQKSKLVDVEWDRVPVCSLEVMIMRKGG